MKKTLIISVCLFMYSLTNFSMEKEEPSSCYIIVDSIILSCLPALEEIIEQGQKTSELTEQERGIFEQKINDVFTPEFAIAKRNLKKIEKSFLNLHETSIYLQSSITNLKSFFAPEFYKELEDNIINNFVANKISEKIKLSCDIYKQIDKTIHEAEKAANREEPEMVDFFESIIDHAKENNKSLNFYGKAHRNMPISLENIVFEKSPQAMLEEFKTAIKEFNSLREKCELGQDEFILLQEEVQTLCPQENLTKVKDAVRHARDTYKHFPDFMKSIVIYYKDVDSLFLDYISKNILPKLEKVLDDFTADFEATLKELEDLKMTFPELAAEIEQEAHIHEILDAINPNGYVQLDKGLMQSCAQQ